MSKITTMKLREELQAHFSKLKNQYPGNDHRQRLKETEREHLAAFDVMAEKASLLDFLEKMYSSNYAEFQQFMQVFTCEENQPNQYGSILAALQAVRDES